MSQFVHLHLHTDYSLLQSTIQLKPLAKRLSDMEMKACAITDYGNMYGAVNVAPRGITRYSKQAASKEKRS